MRRNNNSAFIRYLIWIVAAIAVGLWLYSPQPKQHPPQLIYMDFDPKLRLTDQQGAPFSIDENFDKFAIIYFGFSFCPDICPTELQKMALAHAQLPSSLQDKLMMIFITIDPQRDTPDKLKTFAASFDPKVIALSGKKADITKIVAQYKVYVDIPDSKDENYLVNHTSLFYLIAPGGKAIGIIKPELNADQLAMNLKTLLSN